MLFYLSLVIQLAYRETVGLALNEQLLPIGESVPADETDWTVDALVLGDGSVLQPERG